LAIKETLDPVASEIWTTYDILAEIAEKQGDKDGAAGYRRQAQEAKSGHGGTAYELKQWQPLIDAVVAEVRPKRLGLFKRKVNPSKDLEAALQEWEKAGGDIAKFVTAIRHIYAGERNYDRLCRELRPNAAMIVKAILEGIGN